MLNDSALYKFTIDIDIVRRPLDLVAFEPMNLLNTLVKDAMVAEV